MGYFINKHMVKQRDIPLLVLCLSCLFITSCQGFLKIPEEPIYQEIFLFGDEVKKAYDLQLVGFGGGSDQGLKIFNFTLLGYQNPDLNEARALFCDISTRFLERINSNEELREFSLNRSFSIANLNIHIMFPNVGNYITGIGNGDTSDRDPLQFIYFFTYDTESKKSKISYKEPYEQVKSTVEHQRGLLDKSKTLP